MKYVAEVKETYPHPEPMPIDVSELERLYPEWNIDVQHKRWFFTLNGNQILASKGEARFINQFTRLQPSFVGEVYVTDRPEPDTFGGFTFIKITTPSGHFTGRSRCSDYDCFSRAKGREECLKELAEKIPDLAKEIAFRNKEREEWKDGYRRWESQQNITNGKG